MVKIVVGIRGRGDAADAYFRARAPWSIVRWWAKDAEIRIQRLSSDAVEWADVVIAQRPNSADFELLLHIAREEGKPIWVDCDDNLFDIPPSTGDIYDHYFKRISDEPKAPLVYHTRCMALADVVTVPTQELADILKAKLEEAGIEPPPFRVLPNCILRGDWDWRTKQLKAQWYPKLTVGWMGFFYHWDDWTMIAPALEPVLEKHDARLVILGFPGLIRGFSEKLRARSFFEPAVRFNQFGTIRELMTTFDVGLCPLEDTPFGWGKSYLKALQYGGAGVVPVCSSTVYGKIPELQQWNLIADTPEGFAAILDRLLEDEAERKSLSTQWQQVVFDKYAYESLMENQAPQATLWYELAKELVG